jgi:hypothetical protein
MTPRNFSAGAVSTGPEGCSSEGGPEPPADGGLSSPAVAWAYARPSVPSEPSSGDSAGVDGSGLGRSTSLRRKHYHPVRPRFFIRRNLRITWELGPPREVRPTRSASGQWTPTIVRRLYLRIENVGGFWADKVDHIRLEARHSARDKREWWNHPVVYESPSRDPFAKPASGGLARLEEERDLPKPGEALFLVFTITRGNVTLHRSRELDETWPIETVFDLRFRFWLDREGKKAIGIVRRYRIQFPSWDRPHITWFREQFRRVPVWGWCDWTRRWLRGRRWLGKCDCKTCQETPRPAGGPPFTQGSGQ